MTERSKKKNWLCKKNIFFIPCKPHRERAQPKSDLGRNSSDCGHKTKNKKTKKTKTLLFTLKKAESTTNRTEHFSHFVSGANDDSLSEIGVSVSATGWKPHAHDDVKWRWNDKLESEFSSSKIIPKQKETASKNHFLTVQILQHSQKKWDSPSPPWLHYTGYDK